MRRAKIPHQPVNLNASLTFCVQSESIQSSGLEWFLSTLFDASLLDFRAAFGRLFFRLRAGAGAVNHNEG